MARLPTNGTWRYYFDYVTSSTGVEHTVMVRPGASEGSDATQVQAGFLGFLQAFGAANLRQGWRVIRCRRSSPGSDISVPVSLTTGLQSFAGTYTGGYGLEREAWEMRFVGRSPTSGRRVTLSVFGFNGAITSAVWRLTPQTTTWGSLVSNTTGYLNGAGANTFRAIDGSIASWYPYVNLGVNGYWTRRIRIS